jgi:hypothetical protein
MSTILNQYFLWDRLWFLRFFYYLVPISQKKLTHHANILKAAGFHKPHYYWFQGSGWKAISATTTCSESRYYLYSVNRFRKLLGLTIFAQGFSSHSFQRLSETRFNEN